LQNLRLPIIEIFFQNYIGSLFEKAKNWNLSAENKYNQAQNILLSELGLTNWQPKHQLTFGYGLGIMMNTKEC